MDYSYIAINNQGKEIRGNVKADNIPQAKAMLKSEGKVIVSIKEGATKNIAQVEIMPKKPKLRDLSVLCRQFVSISSAGVPIITALEMLAGQTENKMLAHSLGECCTTIRSGSSLTEAMGQHPKMFPSLLITMVAAGESSGSLDIAFGRMGEQFEKEQKLLSTVKKASIYPITVAIIAFIVVLLMLGFVVPSFEEMLSDLGEELPLITKIVIAGGDFVANYWIFIILGVVGLVFVLKRFSRTASGREIFSNLVLKIPLYNKLVIKTAAARISRTLSTLVAAGIPLIEAIEISAGTMTNEVFKKAMAQVKEDVSMGTPLSEAMMRTGKFPALVYQMIRVGEESGDMESMLTTLANYYDEEVETTTATVMAAIEPLLIVVLALIVGGIVFAVIMPLGSIYASLENL